MYPVGTSDIVSPTSLLPPLTTGGFCVGAFAAAEVGGKCLVCDFVDSPVYWDKVSKSGPYPVGVSCWF